MVSKAFGRKNLFINANLFSYEQVGISYSVIVFSKYLGSNVIQDLPLGLATSVAFSNGPHLFAGTAGEVLRKLFGGVKPIMELKFISLDGGTKMKFEILEKEGLALFYSAGVNGGRTARVYPGIAVPQIIEELEKIQKDLESINAGKVLIESSIKQDEAISASRIQ
jgi:hypothetical protein